MDKYSESLHGNLSSLEYTGNIMTLQANFHQLFDYGRFVFVPKPSTVLSSLEPTTSASPSTLASSLTPTADLRPHALVAHILNFDGDGVQFFYLYHNTAIQAKFADNIAREYLFARFAWAIFKHLDSFLSSTRWVALPIYLNDEDTSDVLQNSSSNSSAKIVKMTSTELDQRNKQHKSSNRPNKRPRSRDPRDGETDSEDDLVERWKRQTARMDSEERDIARSALDESTRWWEEVGRFASASNQQEKENDESTRWWEEVGRFASAA
ncbi:hypothetical protein F4803DRAFT_528425 [Xylaria telfairii]|nr:hypothetical protein F4803DRAFT_528425 [Xylaria telfairii]